MKEEYWIYAAQQHEQHRPPVHQSETPYERLCEEEQYRRQYRQHCIYGFLDSVAPRLIFFYVLIDLFIFIVCILTAVFFPAQLCPSRFRGQ